MIYRIPLTKDNTVMSAFTGSNVGKSEVMRIGPSKITASNAYSSGNLNINRAIMKFGTPAHASGLLEVQALIASGVLSSSNSIEEAKMYIYHCYSNNYSSPNALFEIYPISNSNQWNEGHGLDLDYGEDTGSSNWSQSTATTNWNNAGGDYYTDAALLTQITQSEGDEDFDVDITNYVVSWSQDTPIINNNGIIIKYASEESGSNVKTIYGRDTTTYKAPFLELRWDNRIRDDRGGIVNNSSDNKLYLYNYNRGILSDISGIARASNVLLVSISSYQNTASESITAVSASWKEKGIYETSNIDISSVNSQSVYDSWYSGSTLIAQGTCSVISSSFSKDLTRNDSEYVITLPDFGGEYSQHEKLRVNVFARDIYPVYTYETASIDLLNTQKLYNASYSIVDKETEEYITNFSKYTALNYDKENNWVDIYTDGLPKNRPLLIRIKYITDNVERTFTTTKEFSVI